MELMSYIQIIQITLCLSGTPSPPPTLSLSQMKGMTVRFPALPAAVTSSAGNRDASCSDSEFIHTGTHSLIHTHKDTKCLIVVLDSRDELCVCS